MSEETSKNPPSGSTVSMVTKRKPAWARGQWSQDEDTSLLETVKAHGESWSIVSQHVLSRSRNQCKERYLQYLKPDLCHDPITPEEGKIIEDLVSQMGHRWTEIARRLPGRSRNAVKSWMNANTDPRRRVDAQSEKSIDDNRWRLPGIRPSSSPYLRPLSSSPGPSAAPPMMTDPSVSSCDSGYGSLVGHSSNLVDVEQDFRLSSYHTLLFPCSQVEKWPNREGPVNSRLPVCLGVDEAMKLRLNGVTRVPTGVGYIKL